MKYTNFEMASMVKALEPLLERKDIIGYAAARNTRALQDELVEYERMRDELVKKYGKEDVDDDGKPTGTVSVTPYTEEFDKFFDELKRFSGISHEPSIFVLKFEDAIGNLSGSELLSVEWMFED